MTNLVTELTLVTFVIEDIEKHLRVVPESPTLQTLKKMAEFMKKGIEISIKEDKKNAE